MKMKMRGKMFFWHNLNFNPGLNKDIDVVKFIPNWKKSKLIRVSE